MVRSAFLIAVLHCLYLPSLYKIVLFPNSRKRGVIMKKYSEDLFNQEMGKFAQAYEVVTLLKTKSSWNGDLFANHFQEDHEVTVFKLTLNPKCRLPLHYHPVISVSYILAGELTVISQDQRETFREKESFVCLINEYHYGQNDGAEPAEILIVYFGKVDNPVTVISQNSQ